MLFIIQVLFIGSPYRIGDLNNQNYWYQSSPEIMFHDVLSLFRKVKMDNIVMVRADFQQGMESVSYFKMSTVTENVWLIYAAASVI